MIIVHSFGPIPWPCRVWPPFGAQPFAEKSVEHRAAWPAPAAMTGVAAQLREHSLFRLPQRSRRSDRRSAMPDSLPAP